MIGIQKKKENRPNTNSGRLILSDSVGLGPNGRPELVPEHTTRSAQRG